MALSSGDRVGPYVLVRMLGRGGMGEVWEASRESGSAVALKLLRSSGQTDEADVRRFLAEARLGASMHHPNLVSVVDVGATRDRTLYLAMELLHGRTLADALSASAGPLPVGLVAQLALQALEGLSRVHGHRDANGQPRPIVHRDVKPSNLFVTEDGVLKIIDFGIAEGFDSDRTKTETGFIRGTVRYATPEQLRGEPPDPRTDLFSLALVVHELFTGVRVFNQPNDAAAMHAMLYRPIPSVATLRPEVPEGVATALARALSNEREGRPASASALADELRVAVPSSQLWTAADIAKWVKSLPLHVHSPSTQTSSGEDAVPLGASPVKPTEELEKKGPGSWAELDRSERSYEPRAALGDAPPGSTEALQRPNAAEWPDPPAPSGARNSATRSFLPWIFGATAVVVLACVAIWQWAAPPATQGVGGDVVRGPWRDAGHGTETASNDTAVNPDTSAKDTRAQDGGVNADAQTLAANASQRVGDAGTSMVRKTVRPSDTRRGFLTVDVQSAYGRVFVDGKALGFTPVYRAEVSAGAHRVEVVRDDGVRKTKSVKVKPNAELVVRLKW